MVDAIGKLVDVLEELLSKEIPGERDPITNDALAAIGARLEALAMDLKDRTES